MKLYLGDSGKFDIDYDAVITDPPWRVDFDVCIEGENFSPRPYVVLSSVILLWKGKFRVQGWILTEGNKIIRTLWEGFERELRYPEEKPVKIMEWAICEVGNHKRILDPFMGTGATGVACKNLGREFIGIEMDEMRFAQACKRLQ